MSKIRLWSVSTTIRSPERIRAFLLVLKELELETWNKKIQKKFQVLLIQRKIYGFGEPQFENTLSEKHSSWLHSKNMTYKQAEEILDSKNYVGGGEMRGRQSFNPLEKMGLVFIDNDKKVRITDFGELFLSENYDLGNIFFRSLLKWQYPNPDLNKYLEKDGYNIKPLVATFHLIKKVNKICVRENLKEIGVSRTEFAIFFTTLLNYKNIDDVAENVVSFRLQYESGISKAEKVNFAENYFNEYYSNFDSWKNANEYTDNIIRYFRLTRYFYLRGNDFYIDLEPRRQIEIDSILEQYNASAIKFDSKVDYVKYLGDIKSQKMPWETEDKQKNIINLLQKDMKETEQILQSKKIKLPSHKPKNDIESLRTYKRKLLDLSTHYELQELGNIEDCIENLQNIFKLSDKKPVELERLITNGLHALNDALEIKPNYPVGDDNLPTFTAPANKPDIECFYKTFNSICEVTLLSNRSQWFNEGQPVMRHFRDFEAKSNRESNYCLFIAPKIHRDTGNTFWISTKYEYEGEKQKIIPLTISQFVEILQFLLKIKRRNKDYVFSHKKILELFDAIIEITETVQKSDDWLAKIPNAIKQWEETIYA
jgi:hypothetical protein